LSQVRAQNQTTAANIDRARDRIDLLKGDAGFESLLTG
jgi:hypothetical protein